MASELKQKNGTILSVELVTPKIATEWLTLNSVNNRHLRPGVVASYTHEMENDRWVEKPVASVCFLTDGTMPNGQHTCTSIAKSGKEQWLLVARNVPAEAVAAMDQGAKRTLSDIAKMLGKDFSNHRVAVTKFLVWGADYGNLNRQFPEVYEQYEKHQDAIEFALRHTEKCKGGGSVAVACIARAWYRVDRERLSEFCQVFTTGVAISGAKDAAAIRIRDYVQKKELPQNGRNGRVVLSEKMMAAIKNFIEKKPVKSLIGIDWQYWTLPGEGRTVKTSRKNTVLRKPKIIDEARA